MASDETWRVKDVVKVCKGGKKKKMELHVNDFAKHDELNLRVKREFDIT